MCLGSDDWYFRLLENREDDKVFAHLFRDIEEILAIVGWRKRWSDTVNDLLFVQKQVDWVFPMFTVEEETVRKGQQLVAQRGLKVSFNKFIYFERVLIASKINIG